MKSKQHSHTFLDKKLLKNYSLAPQTIITHRTRLCESQVVYVHVHVLVHVQYIVYVYMSGFIDPMTPKSNPHEY